ncbi:MAG: cupin domain-containing protein [Bacteroidales bacterium]|nr:cupin domain-containing protein [Bacteroidales bacterium]
MPTSPRYLVRHQADAPTVPCPCGESTRILSGTDGSPCSFHVTSIRDSVRHYHKQSAEVYYILTGSGKMELDGDWVDVEPRTLVYIPAGVRHRLVSEEGVQTVVVAIPPFDAADEWCD